MTASVAHTYSLASLALSHAPFRDMQGWLGIDKSHFCGLSHQQWPIFVGCRAQIVPK